ncbi:MAG: hypothetical protein QOH93_2301 [Chloroflexia bacterium]|jgi:hypothetical protein|nr:hypothetical protein [Chloroflexia bacterium]
MFAIATQTLARTNIVKASSEYELARRKAKNGAFRAAFTRRPNCLASMDDLTKGMAVEGEHYHGLQQVPVRAIVGSIDRHRDFDANFNPTRDHTRQRWQRIANAHLHGTTLPAVHLIKIGGVYMVEDGNHRVSVARHFGVEYIDAEVTEYVTVTSGSPMLSAPGLRIRWAGLATLASTGVQAARLRLSSRRALRVA